MIVKASWDAGGQQGLLCGNPYDNAKTFMNALKVEEVYLRL
jgi:hypothetical protein